ncbi:Tad domain-containing protein [Jeotgalibacillus proteolyticus]|uniref:Putative Flp pilus-assembly TadG-like N-terminal domain-containing protein n=1 Tax=Jeotgalibacillus proteolyticus TaxID=2082395 RepID=A0A2S5G6P5_9BACL|nr:Tad domain-containing protein [Jeotgalibacillus proteolyticus]PPA68652.1 hypothetical protein C4B60_20265 [Jeotgalibacillus proteolyticus]
MKKWKSIIQNQKGNTIIFVLGLTSVMMVMFVLVINLAGALVVKEQAASTAQQASLAATAELYSHLPQVIEDYESEIIGIVDKYPESIQEKIDKEIQRLAQGEMSGYTINEIQNKAMDNVLTDEITSGLGDDLLREKIEEELQYDWSLRMREIARQVILSNGGTLEGATITFFDDGQIRVKATHKADPVDYDGFFAGLSENLTKASAGPEIQFLKELDWNNQTYSLE